MAAILLEFEEVCNCQPQRSSCAYALYKLTYRMYFSLKFVARTYNFQINKWKITNLLIILAWKHITMDK